MRFLYTRKRRQQKAFVDRSLSRLPDDLALLVRALDVAVEFRAWNGRKTVCVYHHGDRTIYLPANFWADQIRLAKWMRLDNQATFLHECFHALDLNYLSVEERGSLLEPITGFVTNAHDDYYGVLCPEHFTSDGAPKAQWVGSTWEWNAAEAFADAGVQAFTDLPHQARSDAGLKVTPEVISKVRELLS